MKIRLLFLFCLFTFPAMAQLQPMSSSEIATFKAGVNFASAKISSMSADFDQYKHLDFLENDIKSSGQINFKQPDLLAWQYQKPYNYSIIFKKGKVLVNDGGKKSSTDVGGNKLFAKLNTLIIGSVRGNLLDEKQFDIKYQKSAVGNFATLVPKDSAMKKYLKQIELKFDKASNEVMEVRLIESSDDFTKIIFKNRKLNTQISDAIFSN